ncbi:MAG: mono/diheme cytochrome c family protein [Desulforhopalus sp.]|jgi:mono/diheme cytochrome c family protein
MNYPVWYLPETGGGVLIALIAVLHVFVSHFAVGGGLYLIYAEKKGLRENSPAILEFVKKHARFFLLLTMVFGSITGVGIWFIIALVSPAATSLLIHNFVFGWAAEWVFFMVEIAAAFVYFYTFGRMDSATHIKVGWLYFIAAWMSLFLINGIIGVMLTPGLWAENMDFWVGFFNPSFFPSLCFRTFIAVMIAACYGYFSASFVQDVKVRESMTRFSAKWAIVSLMLMIPSAIWYISVLPEGAMAMVTGKSPTIAGVLPWGLVGLVGVLGIMLGAGLYRPEFNAKPVAILSLFCALAVMGSFEWIREAARRPYVINEVMYSNGILKSNVEKLNSEGYLRQALWVENKDLNVGNMMQAGEELFIHQCYTCHTVNGMNNDIVAASKSMSFRALTKYIDKIHERRYFMPPFMGTDMEVKALATYIAGGLLGKEVKDEPETTDTLAVGSGVFEEHCSSCHGVEDLTPAFAGVSQDEITSMLGALDEITDEMEPFSGTDEERKALAGYLDSLNNPVAPGVASETDSPGGDLLFEDHCSSCHDLQEMAGIVQGQGKEELVRMLATLNEISDEMEPFAGTAKEQDVLAEFLESAKGGDQ